MLQSCMWLSHCDVAIKIKSLADEADLCAGAPGRSLLLSSRFFRGEWKCRLTLISLIVAYHAMFRDSYIASVPTSLRLRSKPQQRMKEA